MEIDLHIALDEQEQWHHFEIFDSTLSAMIAELRGWVCKRRPDSFFECFAPGGVPNEKAAWPSLACHDAFEQGIIGDAWPSYSMIWTRLMKDRGLSLFNIDGTWVAPVLEPLEPSPNNEWRGYYVVPSPTPELAVARSWLWAAVDSQGGELLL